MRKSDHHLAVVSNRHEFDQWINAWGETPDGKTVFPTPLYRHPQLQFVARMENGTMAAGLATNVSVLNGQSCVGISNRFGEDAPWLECVRYVRDAYPHLPIVGYDRLQDFKLLEALGFQRLGPLTVWIK